MKNIGAKKNLIKLVIGGVVLCMTLAACKNFLNAGKVREEIEQQIYINNHECPVATVEEPAFSDTGVAKNKAIIISFSMPINPDSFYNSYQIEDSSGNSLISCYLEPQWSNENKLVTILADEKNLIDLRGKKTMDVWFKLSKDCQTTDKLPIKEAINHKFRINDNLDETPPTLSVDSYVERPVIEFSGNLISDAIKLKEGEITTENEAELIQRNHINSSITIYMEGKDSGGDVNGYIVLKRIKDVDGTDIRQKEVEKTFKITDFNTVAGTDYQGCTYTLNLSSINDYKDGLYEVKVYVMDTAGTKSEDYQLYYIVSDTAFEFLVSSRSTYDKI